MSNFLTFNKENIYHLKRDYGSPLDLYKKNITEDVKTGIKTIYRYKVHIKKAIILPSLATTIEGASRSVARSGGLYGYSDITDRTIIIDSKDVPLTYKDENNVSQPLIISDEDCYIIIPPESSIILKAHRYEIKSVETYEGAAYILRIHETKGGELEQIIENDMIDKIVYNQLVTVDG